MNHDIRLIPYTCNIQGIICRYIKFIIRRHTFAGPFTDTRLDIFAPAIGIIEIVIAIIAVRSCNTINAVQSNLCLFKRTDGLFGGNGSGRIQIQPIAGTGRIKKGCGREYIYKYTFHISEN